MKGDVVVHLQRRDIGEERILGDGLLLGIYMKSNGFITWGAESDNTGSGDVFIVKCRWLFPI